MTLPLLVGLRWHLPGPRRRHRQARFAQARRDDNMTHCSNVPTGGAEALQCVELREAAMSVPCQRALAALKSPHPTTAAAIGAPTKSSPQPSAWRPVWRRGAGRTASEKMPLRSRFLQPQADSWPNLRKLIARTAIAIAPAGQTNQAFGTTFGRSTGGGGLGNGFRGGRSALGSRRCR